ncbi:hypothetical protein SLA2020_524090 [Shorea laevis]
MFLQSANFLKAFGTVYAAGGDFNSSTLITSPIYFFSFARFQSQRRQATIGLLPSLQQLGLFGTPKMTCSEMVIPIGTGNETMFPPSPFDLSSFESECKRRYGVPPRPHWITSYYGGHDIKFILQRFGSNIIFSNGLRDPYSSGGVLENISKSIVAVKTKNGSHCLDILRASKTDPQWLVEQRATEVRIIKQWLANYFADLRALIKH